MNATDLILITALLAALALAAVLEARAPSQPGYGTHAGAGTSDPGAWPER